MSDRRPTTEDRLDKLDAVLDGASSMAILMQNTPDPDAIAAAAALRAIANDRHAIGCSLIHDGSIGRSENAALLRYLGLSVRRLSEAELERYDRIAIVDAQPGQGNLTLPTERRVDIVIDHHPIRRETRSARYTDVRSRYGATSTILCEYLAAAGIDPAPPLATALVYGIRSDTQDLGRESTRADVEAFLSVYPKANPRALGRIVHAPLPRPYFARLRLALQNATVYGDRVVSSLAELDSQEMVAEAADLLLRVEGVSWAMCLGVVDGTLHGSLRALDRDADAGAVASRVAGENGFGGGHAALAGVQIPLPVAAGEHDAVQRLVDGAVARFLEATGDADDPGEPLSPEPDRPQLAV